MYEHAALENTRSFDFKKVLLEKLGWLVYVLILGTLSSALLMGVSYLIPINEEGLGLEGKLLVLKTLDMQYTTENIDQVFQDNITIEETEGLTLYRSKDGSIAFNFTGRGHMGPISGIIALAPDLDSLKGVVILEQQETPGLGGRVTEEDFLAQFRGLSLTPELVILPAGVEATAPNEVDGITGATMTSKALESMLRQNIQEVMQKLGGN